MIISSWNGPFFGEMRSFSRGITPATLSSNDPLVRLNTSTPSKTNMTIEKQPWVKMYLLVEKKRWFSSDRHVSFRGTSQHPLQISPRLDQLRSEGLDHCCLAKKWVIQKGWIWMVTCQELSCKIFGVYHLRWIYVTWVCFLLFLCVCVHPGKLSDWTQQWSNNGGLVQLLDS